MDREIKGPIDRSYRCQNCNGMFAKEELHWITDRYGIPFKLVCDDCFEEVQEAIQEWTFEEDYAGEHLEPEDGEEW